LVYGSLCALAKNTGKCRIAKKVLNKNDAFYVTV